MSLVATVLFAICLGAASVSAQTPPIVVTGSSVLIGDLHFSSGGGGWFSGQAPLGGTFVVGANGDVIVGGGYGKHVFQITPDGTQTVLANYDNSNAAGMDQYGNVYIARDYGDAIIKLPFVAGLYVGFSGNAPAANCQGGTLDQTPCVFAPEAKSFIDGVYAAGGNPGFSSLLFDAQGNFFFATDTNPGSGSGFINTIYECSAQCQAETDGAGTYPPVSVYVDPHAALGVVAVDPWGNLFFSDGDGNSSGNKTYVEELPFANGKYASTPTVVTTYSNLSGYNGISGVVASNLGTIYFTVPNDGVYAIPNSSAGPNEAAIYKVSGQGGKGLAMDATGNLYVVQYSGTLGNDGLFMTSMGNIGLGASAVGTATTARTVTLIDMAANCTTAPAFNFSTSPEYVITPPDSATCATAANTGNGTFSPAPASNGASLTATITFTPGAAGGRNADLIVSDSTYSARGIAALHGIGQGASASVDPGIITTFSNGLAKPASAIADYAGDLFIADAGAGKVYEIAAGTATLTPIGSGLQKPDALAFDGNGDLVIADNGTLAVVEIPNTGTLGTFKAGTQWTVVTSTDLFGGQALSSATGLAVGPDGTVFISDPASNRVVYDNPITGQAGVTFANKANGFSAPMGLATDSWGNLYIADSGLNGVVEISSGVISAPITSSSITQAMGVSVDASGSVFIADGGSGNIVRVPNISGTLTAAQAVTVETLGSAASSLWDDGFGNLIVASGTAKSAFIVQRTAAAIDLGTVADGANNTGAVYLMNAGNEAATLADPDVTQPSGSMFTLTPAATNGCQAGSTGNPGQLCAFTAEFAPPAGSGDTGPFSGNADILLSTPSLSVPVAISGTASVSALKPQTIRYNPVPPAVGFIGQQIALTATATSGLAVAFSSSTPTVCTVDGITADLIAAGTCTIDANQAGGANNGQNWGSAPQVVTNITVTNATPAGVAGLLMNQTNWLASLPTGGAYGGSAAGGTTFGVTNDGNNIVVGTSYGGTVAVYNLKAGAFATVGKYGNAGGVATDSQGNLYISGAYSGVIAKIPYANGKFAAMTDPSGTPPPQCTGTDTAECTVVQGVSGINGVAGMTFDSLGNLFISTDDQGAAHSIWECTVACQNTGSPAPTMLFQEPAGSGGQQLYIGGIAVDPWGNIFFTDSSLVTSGSSESASSNLNELVFTSGSGYASTPTVLQTFTNTNPGSYDDEMDGVVVGADGTVYYAMQYDGIFALPNTQTGGPQIANQYAVAGQGAKEVAIDPFGNIYYVSYSNAGNFSGDTLGQILINNLVTPVGQLQGAAVTASANLVDNIVGCAKTGTFAFESTDPQFSATADNTKCSAFSVGNGTLSTPVPSNSVYTATVSFAATKGGAQNTTLTVTDYANGGIGMSKVTGFGQETPQTITFTAPTSTSFTFAPGMTITLGATGGGSNNPVTFTVDSASTGAGTITGSTLTVTQAGTIVVDGDQVGGLVSGVYYDNATQAQLPLTISKAAQSITFAAQGAPTTYAPSLTITLSATGGASTSPVVFTVDSTSTGAGTVSGNTLTVTQAGNIVVDANQAADVNYQAAAQVQQTFVVNQASQTIAFVPLSQPLHYIMGGIQVQVSANGGATDNPIVFSVDASSPVGGTFSKSIVSGSTSTATLTVMDQAALANFPGNIIVDANQPGNSNYADASQAAETIQVLQPLPTQAITFNNPGTQVAGTPLTLAATSSSGLPVLYNVSPSSVCTLTTTGGVNTLTLTNSGTTALSCTIVAMQPGDNIYFAAAAPVTQTIAVNPTGQVPDMNMDLSLNELVIQPGTTGLTQVTVNSVNNFTGSVSFTCNGLPAGYTCAFNPTTITNFTANPSTGLPNGTTGSTQLAIGKGTVASQHNNKPPWIPVATFAVALCFLGFNRRNRVRFLMVVVLSIAGSALFSGCSKSNGSSTTQTTTANVTITATSGSSTKTVNLTVILE